MATTPSSLVTEINAIYTPLLSGLTIDLSVPPELASLDLITTPPAYTVTPLPSIPALTLSSLTEGENTLTGVGAFDILMKAVNKHLEYQFKQNNISASERGKIYIQAMELALTQASNYLVAAHAATWEGENSKRQAQMLEIQQSIAGQEFRTKVLETITAKMAMSKYRIDAYVAEGQLVATKTGIGSIYHEILAKEAQQELLNEQVDVARAQTKETLRSGGAITGHLAVDKQIKLKQDSLLTEQIDAARAQTKDTIIGGAISVSGILGSQKALYDQQKESYIHDSMNKAAKLLSDAWTTQKTMDDGWTPPSAFLNGYLDPAIKEYVGTVGLA